jgi:hypothetical protein
MKKSVRKTGLGKSMKRNALTKFTAVYIILFLLEMTMVSCTNVGASHSSTDSNHINMIKGANGAPVIEEVLNKDLNRKNNSSRLASFTIHARGGFGIFVEIGNVGSDAINASIHINILAGLFHTINITYDRLWSPSQGNVFDYHQFIAGALMPIFVKISVSADNGPTVVRNLPGFVFMFFVVIPLV